jgi:plastocyanin
MRILCQRPSSRFRCALAVALLAASAPLCAADLEASVLDDAGHGVAGIVLIAEPQFELATAKHSAPRTVIMDQQHKQFVPNILVIQTGTAVDFPNSDQIEHQVYSFSPTKPFQLSLYAGHKYPPIVFDKAGLVVVGCNIHDQMIGYLYVTDSPYFGRSDGAGHWQLHDVPPGSYRIIAWHPRMQESVGPLLQQSISVADGTPAAAVFKLSKPLRPSREHGGDPRWVDY